MSGAGNSYGITNNTDYYSPTTSKLILGVTDNANMSTYYWSISSVNGSPVAGPNEGFVVQLDDEDCADATTFDGKVHTCGDVNDIFLFVC